MYKTAMYQLLKKIHHLLPAVISRFNLFIRKNISKRPPLWKMSTERALRCDTLSVNFFCFFPKRRTFAPAHLISIFPY